MIIGQTIASTSTVYSPWFDRLGDAATFYVQVLALKSGTTLTVTVQKKKRIEADSSALTAVTFSAITSTTPDTYSASASGTNLEELVRFKYAVTGSGGWVHLRTMPPIWPTN